MEPPHQTSVPENDEHDSRKPSMIAHFGLTTIVVLLVGSLLSDTTTLYEYYKICPSATTTLE